MQTDMLEQGGFVSSLQAGLLTIAVFLSAMNYNKKLLNILHQSHK